MLRNHFFYLHQKRKSKQQSNNTLAHSIDFYWELSMTFCTCWFRVWCVCAFCLLYHTCSVGVWHGWSVAMRNRHGIPWRTLSYAVAAAIVIVVAVYICFVVHILSLSERIIATRLILLTAATAAASSMAKQHNRSVTILREKKKLLATEI